MVKKERTFVIIKPDGVQRSLVGEIISRFERAGLKIVAMKFGYATTKDVGNIMIKMMHGLNQKDKSL
jgi:nucleoside-diphosphate kinase